MLFLTLPDNFRYGFARPQPPMILRHFCQPAISPGPPLVWGMFRSIQDKFLQRRKSTCSIYKQADGNLWRHLVIGQTLAMHGAQTSNAVSVSKIKPLLERMSGRVVVVGVTNKTAGIARSFEEWRGLPPRLSPDRGRLVPGRPLRPANAVPGLL